MNARRWLIVAAELVATSCVPRARYDTALQRLETTRAELHVARSAATRAKRDDERSREQLATMRASTGETTAAAAADDRRALYDETVRRLEPEVRRKHLRVEQRAGAVVITLPNDVLFDTGRSDVRTPGLSALAAVSFALAQLPIRDLQVASHTLDLPNKVAPNWELSTARASTVLRNLLGKGVHAVSLSVSGYADVKRDEDRRTEIIAHLDVGD